MSVDVLDDAMKAQLRAEWDRFKKALLEGGDIGDLNFAEWRIVVERDRKALPPAISVPAVHALCKLEKSGLRGQAIRLGEETKDPALKFLAETQAREVRILDADHSEVYAALAFYAARRLGLTEIQAAVFGDAMAYLLTGWMQVHADGRIADKLIYEFKKTAGSPPEGGLMWSHAHSLACRKGFKAMLEAARDIRS